MTADFAFRAPARLRLPIGAIAVFGAAVLFLAGAIHICTILLVPSVAESDGWSRLAAFAGEDEFAELPVRGSGPANVAGLDPLFVNAACRVQLGPAPVGISVEAQDRFWSLALYDPQGTIVFSLNDRTAVEGRLEMLVVSPIQNVQLRTTPPANIDQTIVVESQSDDLIALLRLFAPTLSMQANARSIVTNAECLPAPLETAAPPRLGR